MPGFGSMFRSAVGFLTDKLGKFLQNGDHIRGAAKAMDSLGVGGGRLGGLVDKGFGLARSAKQFLSKSPKGMAEAIGRAAAAPLGSLVERGAKRIGSPEDIARKAGQGIGQLGGQFLSQGLQRILG